MDAISAKGKFIKAFGNKLIYECPEEIEITISPQQKHLLFLEFLEAIENYKYYFNFDWNNITDEEVRNVIEFLENNEEGFYDNCVKWYSEEYKCIKKGAKLVRSLKHFIKDKDVLVAIQDAASRYIQMNKIKGYLCLSVHPLDFLSLSDNSANWSSCHSLTSERCAGNLSYMCDYGTVICYIKSSNNDFVFPNTNISWNNKKWRMLLYTNNTNSLIVTGRQYPYEIIDGLNIVQKHLLEPVGMINETLNGYSDWQTVSPGTKTWESGSLAECFFDFDDYLFKVKTIVRDAALPTVAPLHYNDVLYSTIAKPHYKYMKGLSEDLEYPGQSIKVGRAIKCLHCEEKVIDFADVFLCTSCEMKYGGIETMTFGTCDGCGGRMIWDQSQETEEGEWICPDCVKNSYKRCNRCGMLLGKKGIPLIDEKELCLWCEDDVNRGEPIDNLPGEEINNG